ncbi:MAG: glycoside hydrolase family 127 protein [Candidatus Bathyarchaeia archaeon]
MEVVSVPTTSKRNDFYVSNRAPLVTNALIKLPIGTIQPKGWLRNQLILMLDGITGRLPELSKWCQFETRPKSAWASPESSEFGWEELPYWLRGFVSLGYILGNEDIIKEAIKWIEAVLSSQESNGYFGPRINKTNNDLWPNMIMLDALKSYYEATQDSRILSFMSRYFRYQLEIALFCKDKLFPDSWNTLLIWQKIRGGDNLESVYWLYNHTGEQWLLELSKILHERTADWTSGIVSWHGVNICQGFREPAQYYQQSHDIRHLQATERNYEMVMGIYGQVPGGMFGADENCRPGYTDPRQAAETCSVVEFMRSNLILLGITGSPIYADRCEEIALNSFPPCMTPDLKGLHYLTAPNQIQLDRENKSPMIQNTGNMFAYDPFGYRCCQHNVAMGWPYYAEHLWMATQDNGLAAVLYASSEVRARVGNGSTIRIVEETNYPFDEIIDFTVHASNHIEFPLLLRIPCWCENARVYINDKLDSVQQNPSSYVLINREWKDNDKVRLELPMKIQLKVWSKNKGSVSVQRGPLIYSLKIGERWVRYGGTDKWPAYEVYPTTPWNYGLIVDSKHPSDSFKIIKKEGPLPKQPFTVDNAPIEIIAKGKRIPQWKQEENGMAGLLPESPVSSNEPEETITLVPMGCARLRISAFPIIGN